MFVELYINKIKYVYNVQNTKNISLEKTLNHMDMYWVLRIRKQDYSSLKNDSSILYRANLGVGFLGIGLGTWPRHQKHRLLLSSYLAVLRLSVFLYLTISIWCYDCWSSSTWQSPMVLYACGSYGYVTYSEGKKNGKNADNHFVPCY